MDKTILVIGASGSQGGEVYKLLQKEKKFKIRVLQRKESEFAKKARAEGAEVVIGDLDDESSLVKAMENVYGVFSVLTISIKNHDSEVFQEKNIVSAAEKNNVQILIHSSVARAGDQESFVDWNEKDRTPFYHKYWENKTKSINVVKESKIPHWVILKPVWMMDNLLKGRADFILPDLKNGIIENNVKLDTKIDLICALDQAKFVSAALQNIEKFDKKEITLGCEALTFTEMAEIYTKYTNKPVKVSYIDPKELIKKGIHKTIVDSFEWVNLEGYKTDFEKVKSYGIKLTTFDEFCQLYKDYL